MIAAGAVALVAITLLTWHNRYKWLHSNPDIDFAQYPIVGIDVSKHNGTIDFDSVAKNGVRFVIIKASEHTSFVDSKFKDNHRNATAAGLKVGAYHFFRKKFNGDEQARHFLATVGNLELQLPLVIDVEDASNDEVSDEVARQNLADMIGSLRKNGITPIFYTNGDGYRKYYKGRYDDLPLWLCSFSHPDSILDHGHVIQQYSHWGRMNGMTGDVDLNIFIGSEKDWETWLEKVKQ